METLDIFRVKGDFEWHEDADINVPILVAGGLALWPVLVPPIPCSQAYSG